MSCHLEKPRTPSLLCYNVLMVNANKFSSLSETAESGLDSEPIVGRAKSQALGQKVNTIVNRFSDMKTEQEKSQEALKYENQLSAIFSSEQMQHYQKLCDEETFNEVVCKTLICAQVEFQEGKELTACKYVLPKDLKAGYTEKDEKSFRDILISIGAERIGANPDNVENQADIFDYLRDALVNRGYCYHAYNSADEASIREYGLSPEKRAFDEPAIERVCQTIQKYNCDPMVLGYLHMERNSSQGKVYYASGPNWAYGYGRNCPEWFLYFVNRGRTDFDQKDPYTCRDYKRARTQVEHYCDTLSGINYGSADTQKLIDSRPMTEDDREEVIGFFETMWNHYGKGTPKVALIPNSELSLEEQQETTDFFLKRLKSDASLDDQVKALLDSRTSGVLSDLYTRKAISPEKLKLIQMPSYYQAIRETEPEDKIATAEASIDPVVLQEIIYQNGDAATELRELGANLPQIKGVEEADIRALRNESQMDRLRMDYFINTRNTREEDGSPTEPTAAGFRKYYRKYFSILDQLTDVRALSHDALDDGEQEDTVRLREALASALVETDVSDKDLTRINGILGDYSIPNFAKEFLTAEILYPPEEYAYNDGYNWDISILERPRNFVNYSLYESGSRHLSEAFREKGGDGVRRIIYHDLLKCTLESNAENVLRFLDKIEEGEKVVEKVVNGELACELPVREHITAIQMEGIMRHFWQQTRAGRTKHEDTPELLLMDDKLKYYYDKFRPNEHYSLADRIVRSYCWPEHIGSAEELREMILKSRNAANSTGLLMAEEISDFDKANQLSVGSLVKVIPNSDTLESILENGILSKEFIANGTPSDATPFDTDFSLVIKSGDLRTALTYTTAAKLTSLRNEKLAEDEGLFLVIEVEKISAELDWTHKYDNPYSSDTYEVYRRDEYIDVGANDGDFLGLKEGIPVPDVGIRTGLPASKISYIVAMDKVSFDKAKRAVGYNGFYVPIVNLDGELIFTPEEYNEMRKWTSRTA